MLKFPLQRILEQNYDVDKKVKKKIDSLEGFPHAL